MDSIELDALYQQAVDDKARCLLTSARPQIDSLPDYGNFTFSIAGEEITGWFNQYKLDDESCHIVFELSRRVLLILHKKYLSGIYLKK